MIGVDLCTVISIANNVFASKNITSILNA
jgi:hypothetical protein